MGLVGLSRPDMREADAEALRSAGRIFADNRPLFALSGEGIDPVPEGLVPGGEADPFDQCWGRHPGRSSAAEVQVCKNAGGAHLDPFTAQYLARAAG